MRALDGVRVLEMGQYIAAPYCAMMLADLGAEVIKIERPAGGDPRRIYDPLERSDSGSMSGGFLSYNRNKKSVTLDLSDQGDRARYRALAATADVVVENLRPGAVDRLGVGYDVLRQDNPRLVYCAISGYGRLATRRGRLRAAARVRHGDSGDRRIDGSHRRAGRPAAADGDRVRRCVHRGARHRRCAGRPTGPRTHGCGAFVDQSMYDAVASLLERELMLWDFTNQPRRRGVDRYAPLGALEAKDGHVALILPTPEMWRRLCAAIGRPDLLEHPLLDSVIQPRTKLRLGHPARGRAVDADPDPARDRRALRLPRTTRRRMPDRRRALPMPAP